MSHTQFTLKNGVRLVLAPDKSRKVVTSWALFGVGSRDEAEDVAGISHVLEHMHFKGTEMFPTPLCLAEFIESVGGENNAFTSKEYTGYYAKTPAKHLDKSLTYLSQLLCKPLFGATELEREKGVILQELDMYEDLPQEVAASKFDLSAFGRNNLGRDIIGYKDSIKNTTREKIVKYRNQHYLGGNTIIVLAGDISAIPEKELIALVEAQFDFPNGSQAVHSSIDLNTKKTSSLIEKDTEQSHLVIGFRGPKYQSPDRYAMKMMAVLLGGSMSSRLFTEIREKRGLAYAVHTHQAGYAETGEISTDAGVPHEKVAEVISAIIDEHKRATTDITNAELNKAKEFIAGKLLISEEDTSEIASRYAESWLRGGEIVTIDQLIKRYQSLTPEEIMTTAKKYFTDDNLVLSLVGKNIDKERIEKIFKY